jgi:hypothetical protein
MTIQLCFCSLLRRCLLAAIVSSPRSRVAFLPAYPACDAILWRLSLFVFVFVTFIFRPRPSSLVSAPSMMFFVFASYRSPSLRCDPTPFSSGTLSLFWCLRCLLGLLLRSSPLSSILRFSRSGSCFSFHRYCYCRSGHRRYRDPVDFDPGFSFHVIIIWRSVTHIIVSRRISALSRLYGHVRVI